MHHIPLRHTFQHFVGGKGYFRRFIANGQNASWKLACNDWLVENKRGATNDEIHALKRENSELKRMLVEQKLEIVQQVQRNCFLKRTALKQIGIALSTYYR